MNPSPNPSENKPLDTHQKALAVNLDPRRYGTFAEIGAGQEVVRWFFRAGGAAGTISKSMSAYDMKVSDAIYGSSRRYVSRERLEQMLAHEQRLNIERLADTRGDSSAFFAFADTVSARNFRGTNECHGWMGVKFQAHPRDEDSQIIIHVRMLDSENALQQEALGIVGVNLVHGAFMHQDPERLIESLLDNLSTNRIEVDMIEFSGIHYRHVDNRVMSLRLVQLGLSGAAMFAPTGEVLQPSEVLYKKPVLVERGTFRPVTRVNIDMLRCAGAQFRESLVAGEGEPVELMEITTRSFDATGPLDPVDFLARADMLAAAGKTVLISDYLEYHRLVEYLRRYTQKPIGLTLGVRRLLRVLDEKNYVDLPGGILESAGRLFKNDTRFYVYPRKDPESGELATLANIRVPPELEKFFGHLLERGRIQPLEGYDPECVNLVARDIARRIQAAEPSWEADVPPEIADVIKRRGFFGYKKATS